MHKLARSGPLHATTLGAAVGLASAFVTALASLNGCGSPIQTHRGASPGLLAAPEADQLATALAAMPQLDPKGDPDVGPIELPDNPMRYYFGQSFQPGLVDLVYFIDAAPPRSLETLAIHAAMLDNDRRDRAEVRNAIADQQNLWVMLFVAVKAGAGSENCRFHAKLFQELIVPRPSPAQASILSALGTLFKVGSLSPSASSSESKEVSADFILSSPDSCSGDGGALPSEPAMSATSSAVPIDGGAAGKGGASEAPKLLLRRVAHGPWHGQDIDIYGWQYKVATSPGTTNRVVLSPELPREEHEDYSLHAYPRAGVYTFRNASLPTFRATLGVGGRIDVVPQQRLQLQSSSGAVGGRSSPGVPYDPDLYILLHGTFPPFSKTWQLEMEWYPSAFVGTNLVTRSVLTDVVFGLRLPLPYYLAKAGVAVGGDVASYDRGYYNCNTTGGNCLTHSDRAFALFLGLDYEL